MTDAQRDELLLAIARDVTLIMGALCALPECPVAAERRADRNSYRWGTGEIGAMPGRWDDLLRQARKDTEALINRVESGA